MSDSYIDSYSEENFWDKVKKYSKKAGSAVLEPALKMHFAAQDNDTPMWAKTVIYGALGYFILPVDVVPDIIPGGFADDAGVLVAALATVAMYIKDEHIERAKEILVRWGLLESKLLEHDD